MVTIAHGRERNTRLVRLTLITATFSLLLTTSSEIVVFAAEGDPCGCTTTRPKKQKRIKLSGGDELCKATTQNCTMLLPANLASQMASGKWSSVIGTKNNSDAYIFYVDENPPMAAPSDFSRESVSNLKILTETCGCEGGKQKLAISALEDKPEDETEPVCFMTDLACLSP